MSERLLLKAARGERLPRPPIWLMRQAGRYLPEYMQVRKSLDTLTMFRTPEVAAEITLQPLRRFPLDAAIVYADILLIPDALGLGLSFVHGEGPVFERTVRSEADLEGLCSIWKNDRNGVLERLEHVGETLKRVSAKLESHQTLIGFAGAPWTVACYMVEGRGTQGEFFEAKKLSYTKPHVMKGLIDLVADVTEAYLAMQVRSGAQMIQLFESWALSLNPSLFADLCEGPVQRVLASLHGSVPTVYFVNGVAALLDQAVGLGADVLGVDWRVDLVQISNQLIGRTGKKPLALQGNLDPVLLHGSEDMVRGEVRRVLGSMRSSPFAHIFNLGHGLRPSTPVEAVGWCVDEVLKSGMP